MGSVRIEPITVPLVLGEGPHWIEKDQSLIFVDYPSGTVNRLYRNTGRHQVLSLDGAGNGIGPSFIIPVEGYEEKFVIGMGHDVMVIEWSPSDPDRKQCKPMDILTFDNNYPKNALNDAKCDPKGRLWAGTKGHEDPPGTIDPKKGTLYKIDHFLNTSEMVKNVTISNGLTWSNDLKTFYYIDTLAFTVDAFDYDDHKGEICNRRVVLDYKEENMNDEGPDGMTIDNNGNLWVACYNGGKIICIDPQVGKIVRKVEIPSVYTTSCCFGGPDYSTLFATSATRGLSGAELKVKPDSGKTFAITGLGVKGFKHRDFKIDDKTLIAKLHE